MRILSSIILLLMSLNLAAKEYSLSGETFSATLKYSEEEFLENNIFNFYITTDKGVKIDFDENFSENFIIVDKEYKSTEEKITHRWILVSQEDDSFSVDSISLSKEEESLDFKNIEFPAPKAHTKEPVLNDILVEEEESYHYYALIIIAIVCLALFYILRRKKPSVFKLDLSNLSEDKNAKIFSERLFVHLSLILERRFQYRISGKSSKDIAKFLKGKDSPKLAEFIKDSDEFMYAQNSTMLDSNSIKSLKEELERIWKANEV